MSFAESDFGAAALPVGNTLMVDEMYGSDRGYARGPERSLLEALLFDGMQGCLGYTLATSKRAKRRYIEAYRWIFENKGDYVFGFENVCEALGIDANYIRYGIVNASSSVLTEAKKSRRVT